MKVPPFFYALSFTMALLPGSFWYSSGVIECCESRHPVWITASDTLVDKDGPRHPVLSIMVDALDGREIDVILGSASSFDPGKRPRLARLEGFQTTSNTRDWGTLWNADWTKPFAEGLMGAILAAKEEKTPNAFRKAFAECIDEQPGEEYTCRFIELWSKAKDKKERVFVAFTKDDADVAARVKSALESNGYVAFTYLREGDTDPWAHPDFVGEIFAQADYRLVIDTKNARQSSGVKFENACVSALTTQENPQDTRWLDLIRRLDSQ